MIRTINDGKELKQAVIDFINAKIPYKLFIIVFITSIVLLIIFSLTTIMEHEVKYLFSFMVVIFSLGFMSMISVDNDNYFNFIKALNLIEKGLCYHTVDIERKYCIVEFFVPAKDMIHNNHDTRILIKDITVALMPHYSDYKLDIQCYTVPNLVLDISNSKIYTELEKLVEQEISRNSSHLPTDIKNKGKEMSKAYLMLYCVENTLRLFIESKVKLMSSTLFLSNTVKKKIQDRRNNESQNKYLSIRGDSDLFYLDFKELGDVIVSNPSILSSFPNEMWVKVKVEELGNIRNLIAHNSFIGELETKIIAANYESILRQIEK